ncbi:MAG: hypothetical protein AAGC60_09855 [Acidobacteriota bacterium]
MLRSFLLRGSLLLVVGLGLFVAGTATAASSHKACSCSGGIDKWGRQIPAWETYCGYLTCGTSNKQWECTASGWKQIGWCGSGNCICRDGRDEWDEPIPNATTWCGFETPANNLDIYQCNWSSQWQYVRAGNFCDVCTCYDGQDRWGNAIPPSSTYCGYTTIGVNGNRWQCTAGGWDMVNNGAATNNAKFGINTAAFLDHPNGETNDLSRAQTETMGWYLMMIGNRDDWSEIDWRITPAIQNAHASGLTPILRLCTEHNCRYQNNVQSLVQMLNDGFLASNVNQDYYVVLGPNEPPTEKWMTPTTEAMTPACGTNDYCTWQLASIAGEIANFVDYTLDNVYSSRRISGGGDIGFVSPVFDCHNDLNTPELMSELHAALVARGRSFTDFDAIGMNAYNLHNQDAKFYVDRCKGWLESATGISRYSHDYFITETGMLEVSQNGVVPAVARDQFRQVNERFRNDWTIDAVLFFNATGRNPDPDFSYNVLTQTCEWDYILGGH